MQGNGTILPALFSGLLLCTLLVLPFSGILAAAPAEINLSATLSTTHFSLGSSATLRIRVNGARSAEIDIPEMDDLVFHERGQSSQMQVVNGTFNSSITSTYIIEALKEGSYTIPSFTVDAGGKKLTTEPLSFEVTPASTGPPAAGSGSSDNDVRDGLAFVTVEGIADRAYTGEVMPVTIKGYFRRKIGAEITEPPALSGDGFVLSPLEAEPRQGVENYQGRTYSVVSWQSAITPIRDGRHEIAIDVGAILQFPQPKRPSRNPLFDDEFFRDDLFDSFFGNLRRQHVSMHSSPQSVTVLPLPENGGPPGFDGAVGTFDFTVAATPSAVAAGEPVTLTMTISGRGNFDRVRAPEFPAGEDWKSYSANGEFFRDGNSYTGKKVFEQAVIGKNADITAIPSLRFSYFDPDRETYVTITTDPLPLRIEADEPRQETAAAASLAETENDDAAVRLEPMATRTQLRLTTGKFSEEISPLFERAWFWSIIFLCTVLVLALTVFSLARKHRLGNSEQLRQKKLQQEIQAGLASLHQAAAAGDDGVFFKDCRRLIRMRLASAWDMEPAAISLYDLERKLPGDSMLVEIFAAAQQHAYGGLHVDSRQMNSLLSRLKRALEEKL